MIRPVPGDPSSATVVAAFDLAGTDWLLSRLGEYQTAAAETMRYDGSGWQRVVILEWPARPNHEHGPDAERTVRLMIAPEDAIGLADVLRHTGEWLMAAAIVNPPDDALD